MHFIDHAHKTFFQQAVAMEQAESDPYRRALFYTLGICSVTREHISDLYDFVHHIIRDCGLKKAWQTGSTRKLCHLAFNLYNGYGGMDSREALEYTPYYLFDTSYAPYMLEAIKVRYPESFRKDLPNEIS